jgi:hypothetical protein
MKTILAIAASGMLGATPALAHVGGHDAVGMSHFLSEHGYLIAIAAVAASAGYFLAVARGT